MSVYDLATKEGWIQNDDLYNGSKIYILNKSAGFGRDSNVTYSPTTKVNISASGEVVGDLTNLTRRSGHNTYNGVTPLTIQVSGIIDKNNLSGLPDGSITMTPGILHTIILNGHKQFRYWDGKFCQSWEEDPHSDTQKPYGSATGIPVVITGWSADTGDSENIYTYSISLREDRD